VSKVSCLICAGSGEKCLNATVLNKYDAEYYICGNCGYLWIDRPGWLEEAYSSAIASTDTGLVSRNVDIAAKLASILFWGLGERGESKFLDSSGGYGLLVRLMRDYGYDFYWQDKYCKNIFAEGFEYAQNMGRCRVVTAFEVLEHLEDPLGYIDSAMKQVDADTFIFTTELFSGPPPGIDDWWYYSLATGQHIGFFQERTLKKIASILGLRFFTSNGIHAFSRELKSQVAFRFMVGRFCKLISPLVSKRLIGSKTVVDSQVMIERAKSASKHI